MERYEAILEQLKKAQSRGMETFSNRIDVVVASLEEVVQEAKTSVQEALPQSAHECFPTEDIEQALRAFRDEAESERNRADGLAARIDELDSAETGTAQGTSIELLRSLDRARSQSELLKELLPAISQYVARSVVLVLRDGKASAWSGIGFADGERLRGWQGDAAESTALTRMLETNQPVRFEPAEDAFVAAWLSGEELPTEILLIPVVLRGKLMGAVYVDHIENHPWDPDNAQSLVAQVCWLIDTLQFRPDSAPALAEPATISATDEVEATDSPVEAVVVEPEVEPEPEPESVDETAEIEEPDEAEEDPSATMRIDVSESAADEEPHTEGQPIETEAPEEEPSTKAAIPSESFEPEQPTEPEEETAAESFSLAEEEVPDFTPVPDDIHEEAEVVDASAEEVVPTEAETVPTEILPVTPPKETVEEVEDDSQEAPAEPDDEPAAEAAPPETDPVTPTEVAPVTPPVDEEPVSKFPDEPPPVQPVQPPPEEPEDEMSEDEAQQEEAKRFARLLVSEIKLYNEEQVERGREAKDLYSRLKEDIDRSREMFEKRISDDVRSRQDYFQDELVRILADGDADALGM